MSYPVTLTFPVQWGDMDALGHVNNVIYLRWFESARIALFRSFGMSVADPGGVGPILATTTCDYLRAVVYPAEVTVGVGVTHVGTTSVTMGYALWRAGVADEVFARGSSVVVIVEYRSGRKITIDDATRARLLDLKVRAA
jgi:acyl-CoA thioester hydrolase